MDHPVSSPAAKAKIAFLQTRRSFPAMIDRYLMSLERELPWDVPKGKSTYESELDRVCDLGDEIQGDVGKCEIINLVANYTKKNYPRKAKKRPDESLQKQLWKKSLPQDPMSGGLPSEPQS